MFARVAGGLFVAALLAGCKFPYPPDVTGDPIDADVGTTRSIGGSVTGLWTGASITLHLEAGDTVADVLATAGEPFVFDERLDDGTVYVVTVGNAGADHQCTIGNGNGRVDGADVTDLAVTCTNTIAHALAISTPVPFTFDPRMTRYPLAVSILQQEVSVTVTGASLTSATVAGQPVTVGQPSAPVPLGQGVTTVAVDVVKGTISQRYELVFDRGAAPIVEATYARAFNAGAYDKFGIGVAASGDWAAIGADEESSSSDGGNDDNTSGSGAVYMYRRNGANWTSVGKLKGTAITAGRNFGSAVDMDRDVLVVGAPAGTGDGAVYAFRYDASNGTWREEQRIAPVDVHGERFGLSVAVSGDYLAVGVPYYDAGTGSLGSNFGRVIIYHRSGATWSREATLEVLPRVMGELFGTRIALDNDTLAVLSSNRAHVYRRSGSTWTEETLPATVADGLDVEGDDLVVGQSTFHRVGSQWSFVVDLQLAEPATNPSFGQGVALHRNVIVETLTFDGGISKPRLLAWQKIGATWVPVTPAIPTGPNRGPFGYVVAIAENGVVTSSFQDGGANNITMSGSAWFFR
jgi:hypothetical protein